MRDKLKDEEYLRERYNKDNARYTKYMTTYQTKLSNPEQYDIKSCKYHAFILAFNKFYVPIQYCSFLIMITYLTAQYLIVIGILKLNKKNSKNG